jgi:hypothetical protein
MSSENNKRAQPSDSQQTLIEPVASKPESGISYLFSSVQKNVERLFSFVKEQFCKCENVNTPSLCSSSF